MSISKSIAAFVLAVVVICYCSASLFKAKQSSRLGSAPEMESFSFSKKQLTENKLTKEMERKQCKASESHEKPKKQISFWELKKLAAPILKQKDAKKAFVEYMALLKSCGRPKSGNDLLAWDGTILEAHRLFVEWVQESESNYLFVLKYLENTDDVNEQISCVAILMRAVRFSLSISSKGLGEVLLQKYIAASDESLRRQIVEGVGHCRDSKYALQIAREEIYSDREDSADEDSPLYPSLKLGLKAFRTILESESRSRHFLDRKLKDFYVGNLDESGLEVRDSLPEILSIVEGVICEQDISPDELRKALDFVCFESPGSLKDMVKGASYRNPGCTKLLKGYLESAKLSDRNKRSLEIEALLQSRAPGSL